MTCKNNDPRIKAPFASQITAALLYTAAVILWGPSATADTILFQGFDSTAGDTWNFTPDPDRFDVPAEDDIWTEVMTIGDGGDAISPFAGTHFWGMRDLDNPNGGDNGNLDLDFSAVDISGFDNVTVTFRYNVFEFDNGDDLKYEVNGGTDVDVFTGGGDASTTGWETDVVNIDNSITNLLFKLRAEQNGNGDWAGFDSVLLEGDPIAPGGPTTLTWDDDTGTAGPQDGGTNDWVDGGNNWHDGAANDVWDSSQPDHAVFGSGGAGTATVTLDDQAGAAPIVTGNLEFAPGTEYTLDGSPLEIQGDVTVNNPATINSAVTFTNGASTVDVDGGEVLTLGGKLSGDGMDIEGGGTVVIGADNSAGTPYAGPITVAANTDLEVLAGANTGTGSVTGNSGSGSQDFGGDGTIGGVFVSMDSGAQLSGNLTFAQDATIQEGELSPGPPNAPGTLTFQTDLTLDDDGTSYTWQLFDNTTSGAGTNFDFIDISGGSLLAGPNGTPALNIDIKFDGTADISDPFFGTARTWTIVDVDSGAFPGALSIDSTDAGLLADWSVALAGGDVTLTYTPAVLPPNPDLLISEIMYNPASDDDGDWEWVEVYNNGAVPVDLAGFLLDDDDGSALTAANIAAGVIGPGEYAVLFNDEDNSLAALQAAWGDDINFIGVDGWNALSNGGDRVGLWQSLAHYNDQDFSSAIADVDYSDSGDWPNDDDMSSIYLTNLLGDPNDGTNWALSFDGIDFALTSNPAGTNLAINVGSPGNVALAVPEPRTGALLILGAVLMFVARRRSGYCARACSIR